MCEIIYAKIILIQDGNKMLVIGQIFNDFSPSAPSSPFGTLTAQQPIANHSAQLKANPAGTGYDGYLGQYYYY